MELCFGRRRGRGRDIVFGTCEVFQVFEEDLDAGEVVGYGAVELVREIVNPGSSQGHGCYCWFVGHFIGLVWYFCASVVRELFIEREERGYVWERELEA